MTSSRTAPAPSGTTTTDAVARRRGLVVLLVLLVLGSFVLLGAGFWSGIRDDDADARIPAIITRMLAGVVILSLALSFGQLELARPVHPAPGARARPRSVAMLVLSGVLALLAVVHVVAGVLAEVSAWITIAYLLGALGMTASSWLIGHRTLLASEVRAVRSRQTGVGPTPDLDWTPAMIRRRVRIVVAVFLVAAVLGVVTLILVSAGSGEDDVVDAWPSIVQLAFTAAGVTCLVVAYPALMAAAPITRDLTRAEKKAVNRRVLGKGAPLEPELEWRAARAAAVGRISQPFYLATFGLLIVGSSVSLLANGSDGVILYFPVIMVGLVVLVLVPLLVIEQRRRARYADATRELACSGGPSTGSTDSATPATPAVSE